MSQSQSPAPADPKVIAGRYEVEKRLGAGAMGVVYKARDLTLRRHVAIKTIRFEGLAASQTASDEMLERFKREARTAAQLKHPNIVTIYDIGDVEGLSYIAMEFIDGVGLERIILDSGKVPVARAAGLVAQVADALGFAHQHGVIHRDIKPANIMVEPGERVKVTDFGIAKPMDAAENLTATGGLLGTPSYMSPEQARGHKIDGRSDLFSVGCLLYEMVTGRKAFGGDTITAIIFKIIQEEPPPVRELNPLVPEALAQVVDRALAKSPETRFQTGREFADALLPLTQPGHIPTLRQADVATAPPGAADTPTIATPPTAQGGTLASTPTVAPDTRPAPGATVPVAPTELVAPPPPPKPPPAPPTGAVRTRRPQPLPRRAPDRGGKGRVLAGTAAGVVVLGLLAAGTWWALGRRDPGPAAPDPAPTAVADATPIPAQPAPEPGADTPTSAPESAPTPTAPPVRPSATAAAPPPAAAAPAAASPGTSVATAPPPAAPPATAPRSEPPASASTRTAPPPPPSDAYLDQLPEERPDGRAAGEAVARGFRSESSGSSTFGATGTYKRRPRIPRHAPAEKPAVYGLAWILSAQKAHHGRTGRYGSLSELVAAGDLPAVAATGDSFTRRQYRFTVRTEGDRFRAEARPVAPRGRPFYVDEAGYVLVDN